MESSRDLFGKFWGLGSFKRSLKPLVTSKIYTGSICLKPYRYNEMLLLMRSYLGDK